MTTVANIVVPFTVDGLYVNVVTGVGGTSGGATASWDINPYFTGTGIGGTPRLNFFAPPAGDANRGIITTPLANGSSAGAASTFAPGAQLVAALPAGIDYFGFRFTNEATTASNYGYVTMQIAPPQAVDALRTLGWAYGNAVETLTVTAVPELLTALLMVGGLLAAGAMRKSLQARRDA